MKKNLRIIVFIIFLLSLLIIPTVYVFASPDWISTNGTDLEKSTWLSFWGSYLSFLGSLILGGIALWQNQSLFEANKRLTELSTMAQFYSEIDPLILELEKKKVDNPVGMALLLGGSQKLVKFENSSEIKVDGLWHIRLLFKRIRSFAPNSYNIEFCQIYLDNKNGETQKSLVGHFFPEDKEKYFNLANKTDDDIEGYVIMNICFIFQENDDEIWKEFLKAKMVNMNLRFKYRNAFKVETKSSIRITWSSPKSQYGYKKFKATDYYVYENQHSLLSEKK